MYRAFLLSPVRETTQVVLAGSVEPTCETK